MRGTAARVGEALARLGVEQAAVRARRPGLRAGAGAGVEVVGGVVGGSAGGHTAIPTGQAQTLTYNPQGLTATATTGTGATTQTSSYLYDAGGTLLEQTDSTGSTRRSLDLLICGVFRDSGGGRSPRFEMSSHEVQENGRCL